MFTNITSQLRHPLKWISNFYTGRLCYSLPTIYAFLCKPSIIVEDREWNEISVFLKTTELWKSCQWKDISGMLPLYTVQYTTHVQQLVVAVLCLMTSSLTQPCNRTRSFNSNPTDWQHCCNMHSTRVSLHCSSCDNSQQHDCTQHNITSTKSQSI